MANKLRETLGVSVDFSDDNEEKEADGKTKKKKPGTKCHVKVDAQLYLPLRYADTLIDNWPQRECSRSQETHSQSC